MTYEKSLFVKLLGNSPYIRVLDFLLTYRGFDYSKREIAENANVPYDTLNSFWRKLVSDSIIIKTRREKDHDLFRLNQKNNSAKKLIALYDSIVAESINEQREKIAK